jgi:putative tricarboxylic transport membrane protein
VTTGNAGSTGAKGARRSAPFVHRTDLWITIIILVACAALWFETTRWDTVAAQLSQNVPPTFFPRIILGCIMAMSLYLPFENHFKKKKGADLDEERSNKVVSITFITALALVLIVTLFEWLGTDLSMVLACLLLPILWNERRLWVILPFAILFPLTVRLIFVNGLKVHFLPGLLAPILG